MTKNFPNGQKILQHFPFLGPPNFTQSWILGSKRNYLATLQNTKEGENPAKAEASILTNKQKNANKENATGPG
jgi:hypothetical protein